jgi:hypothetical protein
VAAIAGVLLLAGCAGPSAEPGGLLSQPLESPGTSIATPAALTAAPPPAKPGCTGSEECARMLRVMIQSPDRGWIGQRQPAAGYADGTRLFAYRALRRQLTCSELALAVDELRAAAKSMGGPAPGMTPDQLTSTRALSSQVEGELARERSGRCRT